MIPISSAIPALATLIVFKGVRYAMLRKNMQGREELKQKKKKTKGIVEAKPKRLAAPMEVVVKAFLG